MEKLRRMIMGMLLLSFTTVVKANYYIAENIGTNSGGDATTVEEERVPAVPPTTEADDDTKKALEHGNEKSKPKEEKRLLTQELCRQHRLKTYQLRQNMIPMPIMKMLHLPKKFISHIQDGTALLS